MYIEEKSHRIPASNGAKATDLYSAIAEWCGCLSGQKPLRHGLRKLGRGLGAAAIGASRMKIGSEGHSRIVICEIDQNRPENPPLVLSFAHAVLKEYAEKSKPGSLWFASMFEDHANPQLVALQTRRQWRELVIIPIGLSDKHCDFLELHYAERPDMVQVGLLDQVAETIVTTWQRRSPGLFADAVLSRKTDKDLSVDALPLLHIQNPARLSRSEYRVCMLISHGLSHTAIESELGISRSTLRSHLRNIYAKTATSSFAELTYALLSHAPVVRGGTRASQGIA